MKEKEGRNIKIIDFGTAIKLEPGKKVFTFLKNLDF